MNSSAAESTRQSLSDRIATAGSALTPTERRLAKLALDDPTTIAFGTVADLAREAGTSGPSVVRFAAKLDFDGYGDLQDHVRASLTEQLRRPTDRLRLAADVRPDGAATDRSGSAEDLVDGLTRAVDSLDDQVMSELAATIAGASGAVWVLCAETSATPGTLLAGNLGLLRPGVRRLDGAPAAMASRLAEVSPDDVAVVIDFPRYESALVSAAGEMAAADVTLIAITDGPFSPLASLADHWVGVDVAAVGPFDSVLPVVAVVELLIAETSRLLRDRASERLDRIERLWAEGRVFAPVSDSRIL